MKKEKLMKQFIDHPETKAFVKKFADDIAEIFAEQFKDAENKDIPISDIENKIQSAITSKESEFKEFIQMNSDKLQKEYQKTVQRNNLVKINIR